MGILSAFLIGKEILVETRNINKNIGYRFKADLNTEQIDVIKSLDISIGTEIKIKINKEVLEKFKTIKKDNSNANETLWFKWFTLSNPKVEYHLLGNEIVSYNNQDPDNIELLPTEWNSIDIPGFNKILWTYNKKGSNVSFACNGIIIPQTRYHPNLLSLGLISNKPNISIFDNNAVTPLSLDRNYFTDKLPFEKELQEDIYKDFIAYLLVSTKINSIDKYNNIKILNWRLGYPGCQNYTTFSYGLNDYSEARSRLKSILDIVLISKTGFILNYNYFINKLTKINAILIQLDLLFSETNLNIDIQDKFLLIAEGSINSINDYRNAIEPDSAYFNNDTKMWDSGNRDIIFYLKTEKYNYLFAPNAKRVPGWVKYEAKFVYDNNLFTCFHFGTPKSSLISNDFLQQNPTINFIREYEIECKYEGDKILNKLLQKYIGNDVVIPYSVEDRKKKFPLAFIELERYMQKYIKE